MKRETNSVKEPSGKDLIQRYKDNYHIPDDVIITEEMVLYHWDLEKKLTKELLQSKSEKRWQTFERCYSILYKNINWLNNHTEIGIPTSIKEKEFRIWQNLISDPITQKIYEVGSGKAELISFLANIGYPCTATEITSERGEKHTSHNITWKISDGINLSHFELDETYDVVISNQVIEHLHPEDTHSHLVNVYNILKSKGRYIINTPHRFTGPHDISRVFGSIEAKGMHINEMTYHEISNYSKQSGFKNISIVPSKTRKKIMGFIPQNNYISTSIYLRIIICIEKGIKMIPNYKLKTMVIRFFSKFGFFHSIFVILEK